MTLSGTLFRIDNGRARILPGAALCFLLGVALAAPAAAGIGIRGDFRVDASYVEYLTVQRIEVPIGETLGDGPRRTLADGTVVDCTFGDPCYYYGSAGTVGATPILQDLRLSAWSHIRGLSARVHLRSRFGSDSLWPYSSRRFEAVDAYVDYQRDVWRVRAGRQALRGGLGYYLFDGAALRVRPWSWLSLEGYGGWSRGRTLNEPRTGDRLAEVEADPPLEGSTLWAAEVVARPTAQLSASLLYLRELATDRSGLYSERVALDAQYNANRLLLDLSADFDWAYFDFGDTRLRARYRATSAVDVTAQYRHYKPMFELWSIWGAFSPVAYNEGRLGAGWRLNPDWRLTVDAAYRLYDEAKPGSEFLGLHDDGWHTSGGVHWTGGPWSASVLGNVDRTVGAYRGTVDLRAGRTLEGGHYVGVFTSGVQRIDAYRLGDVQTRGGGVEARAQTRLLRLEAMAGYYDHTYDNRPGFEDYDQVRGRISLTYFIGADPGMRRSAEDGS